MDVWREPWDDLPFPKLSRDQLAKLIAKHGLRIAVEDVTQLRSTGVVNTVYALGDVFVLRVPKALPDAVCDTYTESVAAPVAHAAGVRTPRFVLLDDDRDIVDLPITIFERWHGRSLAQVTDADSELWRAVGADLATLHASVLACDDPNGWLDDAGRTTVADDLLASAVADGTLNHDNARTLARLFAQLQPAVADADYRRFVHNDVQPSNVFVSERGECLGLIDWGDAAWGDPALDFRSMPARAVGAALAGYRSVCPLDGDDTAEARIWWDHLFSAVYNLRRDRAPHRQDWNRPVGARLVELFALLADGARVGGFN